MVKTVWMQWRLSRLVRSCRDDIIRVTQLILSDKVAMGAVSKLILTPDWMRFCSTLSRSSKNSRLIR